MDEFIKGQRLCKCTGSVIPKNFFSNEKSIWIYLKDDLRASYKGA